MKNYRRFFLYVTAVFVMALAASQITITHAGAVTCCTFGQDCAVSKCCAPQANEADCSADKKYYCRASCKRVIAVPEEPIEDVPVQP